MQKQPKIRTTINVSEESMKILESLLQKAQDVSDLSITRGVVVEGLLNFAEARFDEAIAWILARALEVEKGRLTSKPELFKCIPLKLCEVAKLDDETRTHEYGPLIEGRLVSINGKQWLIYLTLKTTSSDFYVDVWNSQGYLYVWDNTRGKYAPVDEVFDVSTDECIQLVEGIVKTVVEEENNAALNISGMYYPLSEKSVRLFDKLKDVCSQAEEKHNEQSS